MANYRPLGDGFFIGPQPTAQDLQEAKQEGINTWIQPVDATSWLNRSAGVW